MHRCENLKRLPDAERSGEAYAKVVMYFGQKPHTGPVPSAEALKVLDAYFVWRRTPEGEAFAK